jgi:hypothetical protein
LQLVKRETGKNATMDVFKSVIGTQRNEELIYMGEIGK